MSTPDEHSRLQRLNMAVDKHQFKEDFNLKLGELIEKQKKSSFICREKAERIKNALLGQRATSSFKQWVKRAEFCLVDVPNTDSNMPAEKILFENKENNDPTQVSVFYSFHDFHHFK